MKYKTTGAGITKLVSMLCVLSVTSCSDSNSQSTDNLVTRIGVVRVIDSPVLMNGVFFETSGPISAQSFSDQVTNELTGTGSDTCVIDTDASELEDASSSAIIGADQDEITLEAISAGEALIISSQAGTFAELQPFSADNSLDYNFSDFGQSSIPDNLTLDIPGDDFPAFSNIEIPDVDQFVLTSHSVSQEINLSDEITWQVGTSEDSFIRIGMSVFFNLDSTEEGKLEINCVLVDDGSFTFSQEQQSEITDSGFFNLELNMGREVPTVIVNQDDAALILIRSSGGGFAF